MTQQAWQWSQFAIGGTLRGEELDRDSQKIMITADCGGSNSYRSRLWKLKLQEFADEINRTIHVSHFPPATSKWNKIEHRLFCQLTQNWRGRPLTSLQVVINLINNTTILKIVKSPKIILCGIDSSLNL